MSLLIDRNDLSAGTAKIDLNSLVKLSEIAVYRSQIEVEERLRNVKDSNFDNAKSKIACVSDAERLVFAAKDLSIALSMKYLLTEAVSTRENVILIK